MFTLRLFLPFLALILALASCSAPLAETQSPPQPAPVTETPVSATAAPPTDTPIASALTIEQLKNAEVNITGVLDTAATRTVRLTDGAFEASSDPASADYVRVNMGQQVAYGDLNGDGAQDAAIIIGEGYGGTGNFVSVVAMLNQGGRPVFASSFGIDDRPKINSLAIQNGEILLDAVIHGPNDPLCCPAQPVTETFRLWGGRLVLTHQTSKTPGGAERIITIDSPASGTEVSGPFTVNGSVTIAPFENNLVYTAFLEGTPDPIAQTGLMVNATEMGGPGTFSLPLDFTTAGIKGNVRIEISDVSAADGANLAVATLFITVK